MIILQSIAQLELLAHKKCPFSKTHAPYKINFAKATNTYLRVSGLQKNFLSRLKKYLTENLMVCKKNCPGHQANLNLIQISRQSK